MLIYIGNGDFRVGLPARNLTEAEVKELGGEAALLATGLYKKPKPEKPAVEPIESGAAAKSKRDEKGA